MMTMMKTNKEIKKRTIEMRACFYAPSMFHPQVFALFSSKSTVSRKFRIGPSVILGE